MRNLLRKPYEWVDRLYASSLQKIAADPEYQKALDYKNNYESNDKIDYGWIWHYAEKQYEELERINSVLDSKAEAIIKNLGGGIGILTVAVGAFGSLEGLGPIQLFLCSTPLMFATVSIAFAVYSRSPRFTPSPLTIREAIDYAEYFDKKSRSTFLSQWNLACVGRDISNSNRAKHVWLAYFFFMFSVIFLAVPLLTLSLPGDNETSIAHTNRPEETSLE